MACQKFTLEHLRHILRGAAGEDEAISLDGDILDTLFKDLGYDSLALLETGSCIEREYGIDLGDTTFTDAGTPRDLLGIVNTQLAAEEAA